MRHRIKLVLGWVCYRIILAMPARYVLTAGQPFMRLAGYYVYNSE